MVGVGWERKVFATVVDKTFDKQIRVVWLKVAEVLGVTNGEFVVRWGLKNLFGIRGGFMLLRSGKVIFQSFI